MFFIPSVNLFGCWNHGCSVWWNVEVLNLSRKSTRNSWQKIYYEPIMDKDRVGFLHSRASLHHLPKDLRMSESPSSYSQNIEPGQVKARRVFRHIPQSAERTLDAPDLVDDYYLNLLLDWSSENMLAVALGNTLCTCGMLSQAQLKSL